MKTIAIPDLRTHPQQVHVREEALLTAANGRPIAVLLPVDAGSVDETIAVATTASPNTSPHSPTERFDVISMLPRS